MHYPFWLLTLHFLFLYIPVLLISVVLFAVPYAGFFLLLLFAFGVSWLAVRFTGLRPVKKKP